MERRRAQADHYTARVYDGLMLVKTRARQPPGGRATDPADFPAERRPKCQRTETSGRPVRGARRILRAERLNRSGSLPPLGRPRARCERGPEITAAPYPIEPVGPSSRTAATSQWPSRRAAPHETSIKLGCGCGLMPQEFQSPLIIQTFLCVERTFIARCFSSGDGTANPLVHSGGSGDHKTFDVPSR